jgi:hypothetical protein
MEGRGKLEAGSWELEAGRSKLGEVGGRRSEVGGRPAGKMPAARWRMARRRDVRSVTQEAHSAKRARGLGFTLRSVWSMVAVVGNEKEFQAFR